MARFIVHTPNKDFNERVMGVQFARGQATIDNYSIDPSLGYTAEEVARRMQSDYGYEVEQIGGDGAETETPKPTKTVKDTFKAATQ